MKTHSRYYMSPVMGYIHLVQEREGMHLPNIQLVQKREGKHLPNIQLVQEREGMHLPNIQLVQKKEKGSICQIYN